LDTNQYIKDLQLLGNKLREMPESVIQSAHAHNQWFSPQFVKLAANNWAKALNETDIRAWLNTITPNNELKQVGIIMAGNIPLVGLHDLISVLATGHKALVKLSSNDEILMKYVISSLIEINPVYAERIEITERLNAADMVIATGSDNSARYFDYYFRDKKTLIRKNRTSIAVLTGNETKEELEALADDIYMFYGLGCRNVTHVLMPRTMDLHAFYTALDKYMDHVHHHKFYNNYMYHKSILLMNLTKHYDNGFMIFQEKEALGAPLATLNYHYYDNETEIVNYIAENSEQLQCIVSQHPAVKGALPFGTSQSPALWHYADNIDTLAFLSSQ
jgi:hypothetical protein